MPHSRNLIRDLIVACALVVACDAGAATPALSTGESHAMSLALDGTLRTWGDDYSGQLGYGRELAAPTPLLVNGITNVVDVAAGLAYSVALRGDGTVWGWGINFNGQLGDGTSTDRAIPTRMAGVANIVAIAAGAHHTLALRSDGTVWATGFNTSGQVGDGSTTQRHLAVRVAGLADVTAIAAGDAFSLAVRRDGTVWAWGSNASGQLGDGTSTNRASPVQVAGVTGAVAVAAGLSHALALRADGTVLAWGGNGSGQLGDGTTTSRPTAAVVAGLSGIAAIAAGSRHSFALAASGVLNAWGSNGFGQLGDGTQTSRTRPVVGGLPSTRRIAGGDFFSVAVLADGTVAAWGENIYGQLGDGTVASLRPDPQRTLGPTGATRVAAGQFHALAVTQNGRVYTWGQRSTGLMADGLATTRTTPSLPALDLVAIAAGYDHSVALRPDGRVIAAGNNFSGGLGDGTQTDRSAFVLVQDITGVTAIAAGQGYTLAVRNDGTAWAWGSNSSGQLGDGTFSARSRPVQVAGLTGVVALAAGNDHGVALRSDGTVWTWGSNDSGQLGDGTRTTRNRAAAVAGLDGVRAIAAKGDFTLALRADGTLYAWGRNSAGELGDGTFTDRSRPVPVAGLPRVVAIGAGLFHAAAIDAGGAVWSWGYNRYGQLGDAVALFRNTPGRVPGVANAVQVALGVSHSFALLADGSVRSWGRNLGGQLGDGTLATRFSRTVVRRENGLGTLDANDWFLDLDPRAPPNLASEAPAFALTARGSVTSGKVTADLAFRNADIGRNARTFVFAMAPANVVRGAAPDAAKIGPMAKAEGQDTAIPCVLAQLTASGELQAVSASNLGAYLSGVLSAQGQSVSILDGTPIANVSGATFYVGYGDNGTAMLDSGRNRSAVSVPGEVECHPQAPQTGWWWNPAEDGRGFSIEVRGGNLFFAAFLYDVSGRSTWYVSTGPTSVDGSVYVGDLLAARGGQTLGGAYPGFPTLRTEGRMALAFSGADRGTLSWPGGTIPIERFNIVPNGLAAAPVAGQPESGWWWNEQEAGRGFFLEWQGGALDIAGYMYDEAGNPVWYLNVGQLGGTPAARSFQGSWWSYANGQTLTGPWKPNTRTSSNVAPLTIQFNGPDTALMTLPNGRTTSLKRHRF